MSMYIFLMTAWTKALIKKHREDSTYIETRAVGCAEDILNENNILILVSKAGGGKSKLCLQLAHIYSEKQYKPMLFSNTKKIKTGLISSKCFVILEDIFGGTNLEFDDDIHKSTLDILSACPENETKFVLTMRTNGEAYKHIFSKHKIFKNNIINLDKIILTTSEKRKIFLKHLTVNNLSICKCDFTTEQVCCNQVINLDGSIQVGRKLFEEIITLVPDTHVGFPQACNVFSSNKQMSKLGLNFFENTTKSQIEEFKKMKLKALNDNWTMYQYCILVYTAIKGYFDLSDPDNILITNILSALEFDKTHIPVELKQLLTKLDGKFFVQGWLQKDYMENTIIPAYFFKHTTILEAVLLSYGDNFLKNMSFSELECQVYKCPAQLKVIKEYVRPKGYKILPTEQEFTISVGSDLLIQGLVEFLKSDRNAIEIGKYLHKVALKSSYDNLIASFFERANLNSFQGLTIERLLDGLTKRGSCSLFSIHHRNILYQYINYISFQVFIKDVRPARLQQIGDEFFKFSHEVLIRRLISYMVPTIDSDVKTNGDDVGKYIRKTAILERNDTFVKSFFMDLDQELFYFDQPIHFYDQIINEKSGGNLEHLPIERKHTLLCQLNNILDGLTDCCKCSLFMKFHPTICERYALFGSLNFILMFLKYNILECVSINNDVMSYIILSRINACDYYYVQHMTGNCLRDVMKTSNKEYSLHFEGDPSIRIGQFLGQHKSNKLIKSILSNICFITNENGKSLCCSKLSAGNKLSYGYMSPLTMKHLLEGLHNINDTRPQELPLCCEAFFRKFVFVYSSIPTFLKYCRPILSHEKNNSEFVDVENSVLAMKLITSLREFNDFYSETDICKRFGLSGNDAVVLKTDNFMYYLDSNYFDQSVIRDIGSYVYNHGILKGNVSFIDSVIQTLKSHVDNRITNIITNEDVLITLPKPPTLTFTRLELFKSGLTNDVERLDEVKRLAPQLLEQVRRAQALCESN
ncbi:Hypothetical predicted protein [Mytilus galloprovincialis]|nr:Hypothetical predicted protein [Mytilus galloprovincialis]